MVQYRPVARGVQVTAMHPLQIWMHTLAICKLSKTNMLISLLKDKWHPNTSMCCNFWTIMVGNNSVFVVLISRFLHLCIQNTYTQDTYNRPLYMFINLYMYMWPHWKLLHTLCSCAGYGPCGTITTYFNCSAVKNTVYIKLFVITLETPKAHAKGQRYKIRNTWSHNKNVHKCKLCVM